ncbi:unnamed protein product [Mytilus coruscus]|uniref:Uncharacterized protein n=1 Tax=Mytilus coruscus TaxID=42192 RepID=A0A6J8A1F0_MYTCO|nr:unnamed protein product [Mytilus coruscus]
MKNQNMSRMFLLLCIFPVAGLAMNTDKQCPINYILRSSWKNKTGQDHYCCKKLEKNCTAGYYVEKCTSDFGEDECMKCKGSTWLADETNSDSVHPCTQYDSCPIEAKRVDYLPKSGCRIPCICDTRRNYFGYNSCNCQLFEGICSTGTILALNGSCVDERIAQQINNLKPLKDAVLIPFSRPTNDTGQKTKSHMQENEWKIGRWVITVVAVVGLIVIICACKKLDVLGKCRKDQGAATSLDTNKGNNKPLLSDSADSGISVGVQSSSSDFKEVQIDVEQAECLYTTKNIDHKSPFECEKNVAHVKPFDNELESDSNRTQIEMSLPTQADTSLVQEHLYITPGHLLQHEVPLSSSTEQVQMYIPSSTHDIVQQRPLEVENIQYHENIHSEFVNVQHDFGSALNLISKKKTTNRSCRTGCSLRMKNINIVLVFTILNIQYIQSLAKDCPKNYVDRTDWKGYCCEKVTCQPGTHVEKCLTDRGKDICKPCPKSTWMLDVTNSDVPLPCEEYDSCPFGSIRVDYLPESSGCHLPCMCDTNKNFFGFDSCNCKIFSGECSSGTVLALNGSCLPKKIANEQNNLRPDNFDIIPIEGTTNKFETSTKEKGNDTAMKRQNSAVGEGEVILRRNDSRANSSATDTHDSENPPPIPDEEVTLVKFPDRSKNDSGESMSTNTTPMHNEEITLVKFPDRCRNDSGISISSHSENTNLMRDQEQDPFPLRVKQVALVSPVPREHAEQEGTTTEPSEETNSGGPCRLVISASTQEHNM